MTSMAAGGITGRVLVVAVDPLGEASTGLLHWVCREFVRPGDVVHLVHVARIMSPTLTIQHGKSFYDLLWGRAVTGRAPTAN